MTDAEKGKATIKGTIVKGGGANSQGFVDDLKNRYSGKDSLGVVRQIHFEDEEDFIQFWVI